VCGLTEDCDVPLHCNASSKPSRCAPGVEETPCTANDECDETLVCNRSFGYPQCANPSAVGERCALDSDCAGATSGVVCVEAYNPPQCQPIGSTGSPCSANQDCAEGLVCGGEISGLLTCIAQPE
jgi:hypothetical protein